MSAKHKTEVFTAGCPVCEETVEMVNRISCPSCGREGKAVKTTTLHAIIKADRQDRITDSPYFFCGSRVCNIVYFTKNGSHAFYKEDLTVRVGIKEESSPRPICYCFNYSVEEIFNEVQRTGKSTVIDDIKSRIKSDGCSCEVKNPQGSCCLGTVKHFVNEALQQFGKEVEETTSGTGHKDCCRP
ncbi:MAG: hypothetical protein IEMM0007_1189 [bacterium]|nr:MAG: hypothetical protein IEMM0007_1189 [bacterium]